MPVVPFSASIAAGATVDALAPGGVPSTFQWTRRPSSVSVYAVQDGNSGDVTLNFSLSNSLVIESGAVFESNAAGKGPDRNQHLVADAVADAGDQIQAKITNTTVGALDVRALIDIRTIA